MTAHRSASVPHWLAASLNYCSRCGESLVFGPQPAETRDRLACPACGLITYVNPRLVVSTLPITEDGQVVLIRRAIEPGYGAWAQPGGFLEIDETATEGAIRETLEETGLLVEPTEIRRHLLAATGGSGDDLLGGAHRRRRATAYGRKPRGARVRGS